MSEPNTPTPQSLEGRLLVASPYVPHTHFARTVVLVVRAREQGTKGIILNRPLGPLGNAVWKHVGIEGERPDRPVFFGGPIAGPLVALHQDESLGEYRLGANLFVASNASHVGQLVERSPDSPLRVFVGHAGWSAEQIAREVRQGVWMVLPADARAVFAWDVDLWSTSIRRVGRRVLESFLSRAALGSDPNRN
ncbi:MAG: YqgE/AlgH family protein [Planctomycetes bacterium]|nr:YqgE/AlgH family protein [Planctomycetota bacterium]